MVTKAGMTVPYLQQMTVVLPNSHFYRLTPDSLWEVSDQYVLQVLNLFLSVIYNKIHHINCLFKKQDFTTGGICEVGYANYYFKSTWLFLVHIFFRQISIFFNCKFLLYQNTVSSINSDLIRYDDFWRVQTLYIKFYDS